MTRSLKQRNYVLLDAGGTLLTLDFARIARLLLPQGLIPTPQEFEKAEAAGRAWANRVIRDQLPWRGLWDGYFSRLLTGVGASEAAIPGLLDQLWKLNRQAGLWRRAMPGAIPALARLREAGRRLAVISNAEGQVATDLDAAGFQGMFETVVDSHLVGVEKPNPKIFAICLTRLGAEPDDCLYVGDVPAFDVEGARAAGIPPVLLDPHGIHTEHDDVPRIRSMSELPALLGL